VESAVQLCASAWVVRVCHVHSFQRVNSGDKHKLECSLEMPVIIIIIIIFFISFVFVLYVSFLLSFVFVCGIVSAIGHLAFDPAH
jgi:glucan phosphoethanolaminetransferase (alkaline phosphatase superfamily)